MITILPIVWLILILTISTLWLEKNLITASRLRFELAQSRLLAQSACDIGPTLVTVVHSEPTQFDSETLWTTSDSIPIQTVGEMRILHTETRTIGLAKYRDSIAIVEKTTSPNHYSIL